MKKVIAQKEFICGNCKYFCQHYRKWGKSFYPIGCGHCISPRTKQRVKDETCKYWTAREE